jgi:voltage-gated hydrogen channel 1
MDESSQPLLHPVEPRHLAPMFVHSRRKMQRFLTSKTGHSIVLVLVILDVSCIFADFIINIFTCKTRGPDDDADRALTVLGYVSLAFSCLFMLELIASVWAFGLSYFKSKFHIFDALVIVASFVIDVLLQGSLEEAASMIVVLRLWRVVKIVEELSVGAEEQVEHMDARIRELEKENSELREELRELKRR